MEDDTSFEDPVAKILSFLKAQRYLLVFDGVESLLQSIQLSGHCRSSFADFCKLVQQIGEVPHQSCLLLTGLESLKNIATLEGQQSSIRAVHLEGVSHQEGMSILSEEKLTCQEHWGELIDLYNGHPLALKAVAKLIRNLFGGNVTEFLEHDYVIFDAIEQIFDRTLKRLSRLEREILYWLVSEGKPVSLDQIQSGISPSLYPTELLEGLESLKGRSLIEVVSSQGSSRFKVPTVLSQCVLRQYVRQVRGNQPSPSPVFRSPQIPKKWIELHPSASNQVHLTNWFNQIFEPGWQPVDVLFSHSQVPALRMRSTLHLRSEDMIKRFKQITLGGGQEGKSVIMLVAVTQEGNELTSICVQAQPAEDATVLPPSLRLLLRDAADTPLAEVQAQGSDSFIQLPYFRGEPQESFSIQLHWANHSHTEKFVV